MIPLHALYQIVALLLGLAIGSFWKVCIDRWADDRSVVLPRSACPSCDTPVRPVDNLPLVSWMALRGRCRTCGWPIPVTYPLVELLGGLVALLCYRRFVPTPADLDLPHVAAAILYFVFASALIIGAHIDMRRKFLPDEVTVYVVPIGLLGAASLQALGYVGWLSIGWRGSALGALAGTLFFGFVFLVAMVAARGQEALGAGDVKLLAMIGAFLGPHPAIFVICMAASLTMSVVGLLAIIVTGRRDYLPFGPALAFFSLAYLFYGDHLLGDARLLLLPGIH